MRGYPDQVLRSTISFGYETLLRSLESPRILHRSVRNRVKSERTFRRSFIAFQHVHKYWWIDIPFFGHTGLQRVSTVAAAHYPYINIHPAVFSRVVRRTRWNFISKSRGKLTPDVNSFHGISRDIRAIGTEKRRLMENCILITKSPK